VKGGRVVGEKRSERAAQAAAESGSDNVDRVGIEASITARRSASKPFIRMARRLEFSKEIIRAYCRLSGVSDSRIAGASAAVRLRLLLITPKMGLNGFALSAAATAF